MKRGRRHPGYGSGFRLLWASVVVSGLGSGMRYVALPLLAAELTSDPRKVSLVFLAGQLPWPLVMLSAGVVADRADRRRLMYAVNTARAGVAGALAVAVALGDATLLLLMAVAAALDLGQRFYAGAWAGIVPAIVPPPGRDRGNAALQGGSVAATLVVGNPVGAALFDVDPALPFTFDALSFLVAAALIGLLRGSFRRPPETGTGAPASFWRQAADGFGLLWNQPLLRRIALLSALCNLVGAAQIAIGVLFVRDDLGLSSTGYGALAAAFGVGSLLASLMEGRLVSLLGRGRVLCAAMVAASAAALGIGLSDSGWEAGCFTALYGMSMTLWAVTVTTVRQGRVPGEYMGRVTMTHKTVVRAAATLGAAVGGLTAHALGLRPVFLIGSALLLVGVLAGGRGLLKAARS
ncbi:MFS transporter [Streptomyces sp. PKU-MA01144]|uniref:MFS transporter n=1 Tax=Streptomyces TaxID=1883 RepID=UPI00147BEC26|nr:MULTISPECIES: MFS transporter [Streptomyces]MCY0984232.1 MFS transporter [Streptomyces tirandamycinicus]NNJ06210.1 MFS transporter [Streptomyces sp. PKU-MA01144]